VKNLKPIADQLIEELFQKTIMRLLGPQYVSKAFVFSVKGFDPQTTLGALYTHALSQNTANYKAIDWKTIETINSVAKGYLDVLKDKTKQEIMAAIDTNYHEADVKARIISVTPEHYLNTDEGQSIKDSVAQSIQFSLKKAKNGIDRIVGAESYTAQTMGAFDGIIDMSKNMGISDPIIAKRGVLSNPTRCKNCWQLWNLPGQSPIPKVYKLSELKGGYMNPKSPEPTLGPSHPSCTDTPIVMAPGFGFDESGKSVYKGYFKDGTPWNEWEHQRNGKI